MSEEETKEVGQAIKEVLESIGKEGEFVSIESLEEDVIEDMLHKMRDYVSDLALESKFQKFLACATSVTNYLAIFPGKKNIDKDSLRHRGNVHSQFVNVVQTLGHYAYMMNEAVNSLLTLASTIHFGVTANCTSQLFMQKSKKVIQEAGDPDTLTEEENDVVYEKKIKAIDVVHNAISFKRNIGACFNHWGDDYFDCLQMLEGGEEVAIKKVEEIIKENPVMCDNNEQEQE